jgi:DNA (cytosine-5)-methyltransferase 1
MRHLDLFSGIGGFALAARWVGWETVGFCEIDPYCQKVLRKHWPDVPIYEDVTELDGRPHRGAVDIITGGFPCQDISYAGKGAGIEGSRSGLWTELCRIIGEIRPRYALLENVSALLSRGLDVVLGDLAEIGYDAEWHCIPASHVGAPHIRDRIWIIAYPQHSDADQPGLYREGIDFDRDIESEDKQVRFARSLGEILANTNESRLEGRICQGLPECARERPSGPCSGTRDDWWLSEPNVGRVANGVPNRSHRLRGLGNAVVPQIPEVIFRAIDSAQTRQKHQQI